MKNRTKAIIILSCALGATLSLALAGCSSAHTLENTLDRLGKNGVNVVVHYDKNGGIFADKENQIFTDAFKYSDVENGGVRLLAPGDQARGDRNATNSTASRSGYDLVGWYRNVTLRVDDAGNPLDDEGNLCHIRRAVTDDKGNPVLDDEGNAVYELVSEAGKPQAQMFSGLWDFSPDGDVLRKEDLGEPEEEYGDGKTVYSFTLYAAWAPRYSYDFYVQDEAGSWQKYASVTKPVTLDSIAVPVWDAATGKIDYDSVPVYSVEEDPEAGIEKQDFSLTGIYADAELKHPYADGNLLRVYESRIPHYGVTDVETGTSVNSVCRIYTTWRKGTWFRVSTAAQLVDNATGGACFEILADLDCSQIVGWPYSNLAYSGTIEGNGHTISNISANQSNANDQIVYGGVFGSITEKAYFHNVHFENVTLTVAAGARASKNATYGLLAGAISENATAANFENMTITGNLAVGGENLIAIAKYPAGGESITTFTVGILCGNLFGNALVALGIPTENITVGPAVYAYKYDAWGNPTLGYTLDVVGNFQNASENYGRVSITVLAEAVEVEM